VTPNRCLQPRHVSCIQLPLVNSLPVPMCVSGQLLQPEVPAVSQTCSSLSLPPTSALHRLVSCLACHCGLAWVLSLPLCTCFFVPTLHTEAERPLRMQSRSHHSPQKDGQWLPHVTVHKGQRAYKGFRSSLTQRPSASYLISFRVPRSSHSVSLKFRACLSLRTCALAVPLPDALPWFMSHPQTSFTCLLRPCQPHHHNRHLHLSPGPWFLHLSYDMLCIFVDSFLVHLSPLEYVLHVDKGSA
jgi:hypothetical protein